MLVVAMIGCAGVACLLSLMLLAFGRKHDIPTESPDWQAGYRDGFNDVVEYLENVSKSSEQ